MYGSRSRNLQSYRQQNSVRAALLRLVRFVAVLLVAYLFVTHFLVASHRVTSVSMLPTLEPGDRVLTTTLPYGARIPFTRGRIPAFSPPARGDLVVAEPPYHKAPGFLRSIGEPIVRFFTLQHRGIGTSTTDWDQNLVVKRVLGVPGDTVRLSNFTVLIRPKGQDQFVSEQQLLGVRYRTEVDTLPDGWTPDLPFSGSMGDLTLGPDEYFLVGDNRNLSVDSRYYGPVHRSAILEKVVLRYFPFGRFGVPD